MENQREIFKILNHYHRFCPSHIRIRENSNLTAAIVSCARIFIRKPFFRTWSYSIPAVALKEVETFVAFWPTILLAGPQSDHLPQFWDGGGNFLSNLIPGTNHTLCGYADLSFTVLLSEKLFADLESLLENTVTHRDAAVEWRHIKPVLPKVRGQTKQSSAPDISREQALTAFHQRYPQAIVRWFEVTDTLPDGCDLYSGPTNCWFVRFFLTYDDPSILQSSRLVAVSKSTSEIVYDDSANDEG
jgi:hypothetical protein